MGHISGRPHSRRGLIAILATLLALALASGASASSGIITITNGDGITIPDSGPATPFPSTVVVGGDGSVGGVTVTLVDFEHTFLADLEIRLVGPGGQSVTLVDNQGGGADVCGTYTFADGATPFPSDSSTATATCGGTAWASGTYGPFGSFAALLGAVASGTWSLYVDDQAGGDLGSIRAWILRIVALMPDRVGYCSVAGNTNPFTGAPIAAGTFLDLTIDQIVSDPSYKGAKPAIYVDGKGITCDPAPAGYTLDGFASESLGVPGNTYAFYKKS